MTQTEKISQGRWPRMPRSGMWPLVLGVAVAILLLVIGSLVTITVQHIVASNENEASVVSFNDWRVLCPPVSEKNSKCVLMEDVSRSQGRPTLRMVLNDTGSNAELSIIVPHGVLLDPGLGFSVAGGAMKMRPYATCDAVGCLATLALDRETLKSLRASANGQIVIVPGNGTPVTVPFSLAGFGDGYDKLDSANGSRAFWSFLAH